MTDVRVMVVDDEPLARQRLSRMVDQLPGYQVVAQAENGQQALALCQQTPPDVICLDIRMPGMDGLQLAMTLVEWPQAPAIIFCTAYGDYALQAFEASAVDYLLKPVRQEKLAQALAKAQRLSPVQLDQLDVDAPDNDQALLPPAGVTAKRRGVIHRIALQKIRALVAEHKYVTVHHSDGEDLIDDSLKQIEERYPEHFIRIHRNTLVASVYIIGMELDALGRYHLLLADCDYRPLVSRRHVSQLKALLESR